MRRRLFDTVLSCCLMSCIAAVSPALAQTPAPSSGIDWNSDVITAVGIGVPPANATNVAQARAMAVRAALVDARRNLLTELKGVAINAETTVENAVTTSDVIHEKVDGMVKGSRQVGQPKYLSDGSVEVTVAMRRNDLANAVLPEAGFAPTPLTPSPAPTAPPPSPPAAPAPGVYTGLIIDARGLDVTPAMAPKVLDDKSQEVYGTSFVTRDYAVKYGVSGYVKDLDSAKKNERSGANPLIVKGASVTGANKTDVTLSAQEAGKVRDAAQAQTFLSQCKVLFVID